MLKNRETIISGCGLQEETHTSPLALIGWLVCDSISSSSSSPDSFLMRSVI